MNPGQNAEELGWRRPSRHLPSPPRFQPSPSILFFKFRIRFRFQDLIFTQDIIDIILVTIDLYEAYMVLDLPSFVNSLEISLEDYIEIKLIGDDKGLQI